MHFTGTIWRPPYEAASLLIQVTAGCTHHRCKFCTLYNYLPFPFRMSPLEEIEADLLEVQTALHSPMGKLTAALQGRPVQPGPDRAFLTGANPFVLKPDRLLNIARLIRQSVPTVQTIGSFARITDVGLKTDGELDRLRAAGYDGLTLGVETGDGPSLAFMDKGYTPEDILVQCRRLDQAGIGYRFFYLTGIAGAGQGERSALASAEVFNQLRPQLIGSSMLTVYPAVSGASGGTLDGGRRAGKISGAEHPHRPFGHPRHLRRPGGLQRLPVSGEAARGPGGPPVCPGPDHPAGERGPAAVLPDQPAPPVDQSFTRTSTISPIYRV